MLLIIHVIRHIFPQQISSAAKHHFHNSINGILYTSQPLHIQKKVLPGWHFPVWWLSMLSANNPDQLWYENLASLIHCVQPFWDFYHRMFINLYSYNNQINLLEICYGWGRCSIVILWITLSQNHFGQSHWAKTKKNNEMISRLNLSHTNLSLLYLWKQIIPITYKSKCGSHLEV